MNSKEIIAVQLKNNQSSHAYIILGEPAIPELMALLGISQSDLYLIDEQPIKINQIRQLFSWIQLTPHSSKYKLAVILNVERMTIEAGNALLKILEEPPPNSMIILQAEKKEKILPTILSRCQLIKNFEFKKGDSNKLDGYREPAEIAKISFKERFEYAGRLATKENLPQILKAWEEVFRQKLLQGDDSIQILRLIARVRSLLSTNISLKLLLENLLIKL